MSGESTVEAHRGIRRVAIVGVGAVGSAFAFALVHEGRVRELLLIDRDHRLAEGQAMDLSHCLPYGRPMKLEAGTLDDAADCDLVVVTAGAAQRRGESRTDLLKRNAEVFASLFPRLTRNNPHGLFVIITNPVDVMTRLALQLSGISPSQVFGTGTTLDTARFRVLLSQHLGVDPRNIHAYVIGEHGDSEVLVWSRATIGPYNVHEYARLIGKPITDEVRHAVEQGVRRAAYEIIERKGATNFAIGVAMQRIFESINYNQSSIQTVTRRLAGAWGQEELCLASPCQLTRTGAAAPLGLALDEQETAALMRSAAYVDQVYQELMRAGG